MKKSFLKKISSVLVVSLIIQLISVSGLFPFFSKSASAADTSLKVQLRNANTEDKINTLFPWFTLINTSSEDINLSDVTLRYYYTSNGSKTQKFWCDWSNIGATNVIGSFAKLTKPAKGADTCLEISFKDSAGAISPDEEVVLQLRVAKEDWSNYSQKDDYSYNGSLTKFVDCDKVTAYLKGSCVWGVSPGEVSLTGKASDLDSKDSVTTSTYTSTYLPTSTPIPSITEATYASSTPEATYASTYSISKDLLPLDNSKLIVQLRNANNAPKNNTIYPWLKIINSSSEDIRLQEITIRYFYTVNGKRTQNFWCDWSSVGSECVKGKFIKLTKPFTGADTYLELSFTESAGILGAGEEIEVQCRIAKVDWSDYIQTDDYSFNNSLDLYQNNLKLEAYIDGNLVWGDTPVNKK